MRASLFFFFFIFFANARAMELEDVSEPEISVFDQADTDVMAIYHSSKKKFMREAFWLGFTSPLTAGLSLCLIEELPNYYRQRIYPVLKAAKIYATWQSSGFLYVDRFEKNKAKKILEKLHGKLQKMRNNNNKKEFSNIDFNLFIERLNNYANMPINNINIWKKKSYRESVQDLFLYLFANNGQKLYEDMNL